MFECQKKNQTQLTSDVEHSNLYKGIKQLYFLNYGSEMTCFTTKVIHVCVVNLGPSYFYFLSYLFLIVLKELSTFLL